MAGWLTQGLPTVGPFIANGSTVFVDQITQNSTNYGGAPVQLTLIPANGQVPLDTEQASGMQPLSVAATAWQIAAHAAGLIENTASSTAGAATLNTVSGLVTTESLSTAINSTYTFTLTNSLITATSPIPQVSMTDFTNTAGQMELNSITNAAGSFVAVFTNVGTAALNGKKLFCFHV